MARKKPTKNKNEMQKKGSGMPVPETDPATPVSEDSQVTTVDETGAGTEAIDQQQFGHLEVDKVTDLDKRLDEAFAQLEKSESPNGEATDGTDGKDEQSDSHNLDNNRLTNKESENMASNSEGSGNKVTNQGSGNTETNSSGKGVSGIFGILISIIALVIAIYAAYMLYESRAELASSGTSIQALEAEIASLKQTSNQKIDQLANELKQNSEQLKQAQTGENAAISELRVALDAGIEQLRTELQEELSEGLGTSGEDWLLAEVEYLIRLANQRVLMEKDVRGAIALLTSADQIVAQASGITAFKLRETLALDIENLQAVENLDVDGIFVSLSAMSSRVTKLPRKQPVRDSATSFESAAKENVGYYQQFVALMSNLGNRIVNLVDYRRDGVAITPILPPKEEYYLRQNLILKLEMAQLGLLRNDETVYRTSLTEAKSWINQHFIENDQVTISMIHSLDEALSVDVARPLPDISGSMRAVRDLLNTFHQQDSRGAVK